MVGGVVVAEVHAGDLRTLLRADPQGDDARGVRLQREVHDVIPQARALDELRAAGLDGGCGEVHVGLGRGAPVLVLLQGVLSLAHG